jgi:hypothetical protein
MTGENSILSSSRSVDMSLPSTTDSTTNMDSPDGLPASVTSVVLGLPSMSLQLLPSSHISCHVLSCVVCLVLWNWSAKTRAPFLICISLHPHGFLPMCDSDGSSGSELKGNLS